MNAWDTYKNLDVVLAHDWLTGMRGGEKCLELLCNALEQPRLYTLIHQPDTVSADINRRVAGASFLNHIPGIAKRYRYFLPVFPRAIESFHPGNADLVISTSHCVAKGIRTENAAPHICYCFTPMRYAWVFYSEYFGNSPLKKLMLRPTLAWLRHWDFRASRRVTQFVAISEHVQKRIERFYNREACIVYPPVDTKRLGPSLNDAHDGFDLIVSALVPYKRVDLAVEAYRRLDYPLKIVGRGTDLNKLKAMAGPRTEFLEWQPDHIVDDLYQRCRCLVFPGEEDFGIVPVEAQACGRPVVAYKLGGAMETVVAGRTGIFFDRQNPDALIDAVRRCGAMNWDKKVIRANAERFSTENYMNGLASVIDQVLAHKK
ncbi:MAG: glycosyltransferase family 4 protein [Spartobacteria bacterium]|nr:glycosyltransferase family 4 protein [Spartobacteria bacterium]